MKWITELSPEEMRDVRKERKDNPLGGGMHTFTFTINMRGNGSDYSSDMTYVVKAYSLSAAIKQVADRPFEEWMKELDTVDRRRGGGVMPSNLCLICNNQINVQIFKNTGICSENCRKDRDNDHQPWGSTTIESPALVTPDRVMPVGLDE